MSDQQDSQRDQAAAIVAISEILDRLKRQNDVIAKEYSDHRTEVALLTQQIEILQATVATIKRIVQDGNGHLPLSTRMYLVEDEIRKSFGATEALQKDFESYRKSRKEADTRIKVALITGMLGLIGVIIGAVAKLLAN